MGKFRCMGCMEEYDDNTTVCPYCGYVKGTPAKEIYQLQPESILSGRYIIGKVLGFGGFGITYIAWDSVLEKKVAVKSICRAILQQECRGKPAYRYMRAKKRNNLSRDSEALLRNHSDLLNLIP